MSSAGVLKRSGVEDPETAVVDGVLSFELESIRA